jgi:TrmH family RNA methyltransferase
MKEIITSNQNPKVKQLQLLLSKASERREKNMIVIEGAREISIAITNGFDCKTLFYCKDYFSDESKNVFNDLSVSNAEMIEIAPHIFEKLAFRNQSDGLLMLSTPKFNGLESVTVNKNSFFIVLEQVEKPGNLGAVLRTADASGADAVIVCDPRCDVYNPNTIRSSVGCLFSTKVILASNHLLLDWLLKNNIQSYAAAFATETIYHQLNYTKPTAIVFGTEADGLTDFWLQHIPIVKIPMYGKIDSLNLSNSVAIFTYEWVRQSKATT